MTYVVLFSVLEHIFTTIKTKSKIVFAFLQVPMGVCGIFRQLVQGGSNELISKFLSSMILYNHPSYLKSGEIYSCRLSPIPIKRSYQCSDCNLQLQLSYKDDGFFFDKPFDEVDVIKWLPLSCTIHLYSSLMKILKLVQIENLVKTAQIQTT